MRGAIRRPASCSMTSFMSLERSPCPNCSPAELQVTASREPSPRALAADPGTARPSRRRDLHGASQRADGEDYGPRIVKTSLTVRRLDTPPAAEPLKGWANAHYASL